MQYNEFGISSNLDMEDKVRDPVFKLFCVLIGIVKRLVRLSSVSHNFAKPIILLSVQGNTRYSTEFVLTTF